ncbi:MAG: aspartate kinase [Planctomycetota bacterium]
MVKVVKFGGTSVATAEQQVKVKRIVEADPERRFIVPSAPGKAHKDDTKVTDLLYLAHQMVTANQPLDAVWERIRRRFHDIIDGLGISCDLDPALEEVRKRIERREADEHYIASRGEALNGIIIAALCEAEYVDAAEVIRFDRAGRMDPISYDLIRERCAGSGRYVIPGFYGAKEDGTIRTFSRGGSDITGAVVANAMDASVYENWTDVSGFRMTDPRVVPEAKQITEITYGELRELSYMGASVLHEGAVFPVIAKGIPINIRNTNEPDNPGTMILASRDAGEQRVVGVAGKKGFSVFTVEKALMNEEVGFDYRVLGVFDHLGISVEHTPSGIDTISIVVADSQLQDKESDVLAELQAFRPDSVTVTHGFALIATVGQGMASRVGTAATLFSALSEAGVNVRMIDQGSSEQNIIIGIEEADYAKALGAIYHAFEG